MLSEPVWFPLAQIIETNRSAVAETGEPHFVRDEALLEMACARPKNLLQFGEGADMASLAVALLLGIARLHPFEQGNKRTALTSSIMFLRINGYDLKLPDSELLADVIIKAVERRLTEEKLVEVFRLGLVAYG